MPHTGLAFIRAFQAQEWPLAVRKREKKGWVGGTGSWNYIETTDSVPTYSPHP